jgi:transcriptional regulator with XRE-family HTH domain
MSDFKAVGMRVKEERERLGYNQTDFAMLGGMSRKTQFDYESGARAPDGSYLIGIAVAGADVQYIITGLYSDGVSKAVAADQLSRRAFVHARNYEALCDEDKQILERMVNLAEKSKKLRPRRSG